MAERSVNQVILLGRIGRDAETKFTQSGVACSNFSIATSRRWKDGGSGESKEETDWHNIVLWRSENLSNYLLKGKQVYVQGRLQTRSWEDSKSGEKKYKTEIVADQIVLLGGGEGNGNGRGEGGELASAPRSSGRGQQNRPAPGRSDDGGISDEDVPF